MRRPLLFHRLMILPMKEVSVMLHVHTVTVCGVLSACRQHSDCQTPATEEGTVCGGLVIHMLYSLHYLCGMVYLPPCMLESGTGGEEESSETATSHDLTPTGVV